MAGKLPPVGETVNEAPLGEAAALAVLERAAENESDVGAAGGHTVGDATPPQSAESAKRESVPLSAPPASPASSRSRRGGARPGAGRKPGGSRKLAGAELDATRAARAGAESAELQQLRARVAELEARGQSEQAEFIAMAAGETCDTLANLAAAVWGSHCRLEPEQKSRLGELWGKALTPMLAEQAEHLPLAAACILTGGIALEKFHAHRVAVAAAQPLPTVDRGASIDSAA